MSSRVEGMLGYAREEWLSEPGLWAKLLHPDDRERALSGAARARETGERFRLEYRMVAKDGRVVWVRDEAAPVPNEEGRPDGWRGVMLDITESEEME
ncbi:MAG: PAS domain-containing protein, partial [Rubrobacteraceae bacterium]